MGRFICATRSHISIEFDKGRIDYWCVYITYPDGKKIAPTDLEYFSRLAFLSSTYTGAVIYNHFVFFYNLTTAQVDMSVVNLIKQISNYYGDDAAEIELWFLVIYAGMIAEENKKFAVLKKRIKRLGMHQLLIQNFVPSEAATFSKGKKHTELDIEMKKYNI